jgi:DNA-directed RNA polymerase beta subunit
MGDGHNDYLLERISYRYLGNFTNYNVIILRVKEEEVMMEERKRMEILLEEIRSDVKLALEGHGILHSKTEQAEKGIRSDMQQMGINLHSEMKQMEKGIRSNMQQMEQRLNNKIDVVHTSLKNEIIVTAMAINDKLEAHIKQPAHC